MILSSILEKYDLSDQICFFFLDSMPSVQVKTRFKTLEQTKEREANKLPASICDVKIEVKGW